MILKFLSLAFLCGIVFGADLRIDKKDLPKILDVTTRTLFHEFPGTLCRASKNPTSSFLTITPVSCKTSSPSPLLSGGFSNTTCFKLDSLAGTVAQLKILCSSADFSAQQEQSVRVTIVDSAPKCRNITVSVTSGEARFFLRADDPDDNNILFHVRDQSLSTLGGTLKYCVGCDGDSQGSADDSKNWKLYSDVLQDMTMHKFSRMFSYKNDAFINNKSFQEVLSFSARDISDMECPQDGEIRFVSQSIDKPTVSADSTVSGFINRPQTVSITGSGTSSQLTFRLKSIPNKQCAVVCRIPEAARLLLRDFPSVKLDGSILEPCTAANALSPGDTITLSSATKDTFFSQTFVTLNILKTCNKESFSVVSVDEGVESDKLSIGLSGKEVSQRCVPFSKTFSPSQPVSFTAESFVSSPGPFSATLLTTPSAFDLQSGGAKIDLTPMTPLTTLVFVGSKTVDVTVMVEASNPRWTGFCKLSFQTEASPAPPTPTSTKPSTRSPTTNADPTNAPQTPQPSAQLQETKPFNYTVLIFFLVVVVIVLYFFRDSISHLFFGKKNTSAPRRYGVAPTVDED